MARRFFFVSLGILALAVAYHLGARTAGANAALETRYVPILEPSVSWGWLDRHSGCFKISALFGSRVGYAPPDTRYITFSSSFTCDAGNPQRYLYAFMNDGTGQRAEVLNCYTDPISLGPWEPAGSDAPCDPSTSVFSVGSAASLGALDLPRPNPMTGETMIEYSLTGAGAVRIDVYDVSGRLVRPLVDAYQGGGWQQVVWDGLDAFGERLPSGTYFYRLQVDGRTIAREKAVVLK